MFAFLRMRSAVAPAVATPAAASSKVMLAGFVASIPSFVTDFLGLPRQAYVLGIGTESPTGEREDLVARLEEGHILADRLDLSGQFHPEDWVLRASEAKDEARHESLPPRDVEPSNPHVTTVHRRRTHLDQHLAILWNRLLYPSEFKHIGRTVPRAHDCPHCGIPSA